MDQSKSTDKVSSESQVPLPRRGFTIEFMVGLFALVGVLAAGYLAVGLGDLQFGSSNQYTLYAIFDNISGLKKGASVEIAGVQIGDVTDLKLDYPAAKITMNIHKGVQIRDDDIASIRTKGIIGDRYVKISPGASEKFLPENGTMVETESVIDIEDIIGKFVHSLGGDKDEEEKS
ncbi:MAG: outer membrane lipid asymmetry maintenance protein MlaD [Oligoflexia bacterium]|nr:outer membrane lipid asymmetry maintenance protein MlaD [Oligoflexia bacterium]